MVNKEVQKCIADVRSELLFMNDALREKIVVEIQEQQRELVAEEANEKSLHYNKLNQELRMTLRGLREMEEYRWSATEDQVDEAKSLSVQFSENPSATNSIFIRKKLPKHVQEESILLDISADGDSDDEDISHGDTSSRPAKCEQEGNQRTSSDIATADKDEGSRNPSHSSKTEKKCEKITVHRTLMKEQWKEWMDKQEMRGNHNKVQPDDEQKTEKQKGAAHPASEKQKKPNIKGGGTVRKIKTYLSEFFNPRTACMWKRLEDETDHLSSVEE